MDDFTKLTSFVNNIKDMFLSGNPNNNQPENLKKEDPKPNSNQSVEPEIIISNFIPKIDADTENSDDIMEKITVRRMKFPITDDAESIQKYLKDLKQDQIKNSFAAMQLMKETKSMDGYEKRKALKEKLETYENMEKRLVHQLQKAREDISKIQAELEESAPKHRTKRSLWNFVDSGNAEANPTTKLINTNSLEVSDQTDEADAFMNEISKEKYYFEKDIQQDIYKMKPTLLRTKSNSITKETSLMTSPGSDPGGTWSDSTTTVPSSSNFYNDSEDAPDQDETGLVDNVFKKLMIFLSSFHKKIISYMQFITN